MNGDFLKFACLVAGENPEDIIKKYDNNVSAEPYVAYKFTDASKLKKLVIEGMEEALKNINNEKVASIYREEMEEIKMLSDEEFFIEHTKDYEHDEKTGDAISYRNRNGEWSSAKISDGTFAKPFVLKDGTESYQARKCDIDWSAIHKNEENTNFYEGVWELVMEDRKPITDVEKTVYENMHNRKDYFSKFGSKKNYVIANTFFWTYAYVDKGQGWCEMNDQMKWTEQFFDYYIENLPDNTLLTIYECSK